MLNLKIYNTNIAVSSSSNFVFENLKKDFALYSAPEKNSNLPDSANQVGINIHKEQPPYEKIPPLEASLYNRGSICYRNKNVHYVDYSGKCLMIYDFKKENANIYSEDENLLYEKSRLAILSRVGELMDNKHIHRIHALGLAKNGKATICLLPMEGGKTTLGLGVLKRSDKIKLLSDDICFIGSKNYIYPFILRIGIRDANLTIDIPDKYITKINRSLFGEKYFVDFDYFKDRLAEKCKIHNILIGKRFFQEQTEIIKISKIKCFIPFIQFGVFGLGLPQIVELFLRENSLDILKKFSIVCSRTFLFLKAILQANTYEIKIGRNLKQSAERLIEFMNED